MKNNVLIIGIWLLFASLGALADAYVPEFNKMQTIRCDAEETLYNQDGSVVNRSKYFRIFRIDDEYQKLYIQKEPIDKILQYDKNIIKAALQSMTDDSIIMSTITIDRQTGEYFSESKINYDNESFGTRYSKSSGTCRVLD